MRVQYRDMKPRLTPIRSPWTAYGVPGIMKEVTQQWSEVREFQVPAYWLVSAATKLVDEGQWKLSDSATLNTEETPYMRLLIWYYWSLILRLFHMNMLKGALQLNGSGRQSRNCHLDWNFQVCQNSPKLRKPTCGIWKDVPVLFFPKSRKKRLDKQASSSLPPPPPPPIAPFLLKNADEWMNLIKAQLIVWSR